MFELHPQLVNDSIVLGDFPLCRLLLINDAHYPWFVLVPRRDDIQEIYQLNEQDQQLLLRESSELGQALMTVFNGDKLNVAALGNMVPQLHIHHIVRFKSDAAWPGPIWGVKPLEAYSAEGLDEIRAKLAECGLQSLTPCA